MTARDRIILQKMVGYAADAQEYVSNMNFESFMADKKTVSACAFAIGQIGELASNISEETQQSNDGIPWRSIRGMRNKIVHDYEHVDSAVLWGTITKSLPDLIRQLDERLEQEAGTLIGDEPDTDEEPEQGMQFN